MSLILKLCIFILLLDFSVALNIIPKTILTQVNGSYTAMIVGANIKPKQCYVTDGRFTYEIDLTTSGNPLIPNNTFPPPESNTNMTSLGNRICGFKLDYVQFTYTRKWNISFYDETDYFFYKTVDVILENKKLNNQTKYATIGNSLNISCNYLNSKYFLNCDLYDPQGTLITSDDIDCNHQIKISKISDFGVWKCILHFENNMAQKEIYYNIVEQESMIDLWQNETDTHINIGCQIKNIKINFDIKNHCKMIRPDGEIFVLKEGLATDRYTALGTNIEDAICGMEIQKPLEEFENGLWRCEFNHVPEKNSIGGFINLSNGSMPSVPPEIPKKIFTILNERFSIKCRVPYSIPYCYIRSPNGNIYPYENDKMLTVGLCELTKTAFKDDNGTWACGFANKAGEPDDIYTLDVVVLDDYSVKPENIIVKSDVNSNAYLKCSTKDLGDYPIQYCRFQNNVGVTYNINPEVISTNRISYYGRGLKYGDCGIELKNVQVSDAGPWTCITRVGNNFQNPEINNKIILQVNY